MRETFSIESGVAISLQRLGIRNIFCILGAVFGVVDNINFGIVRKNCRLVRVHL